MTKYIAIVCCSIISLSCSNVPPPRESTDDSLKLESAINALSDTIDAHDARLISKLLIVSTSDLAQRYRMASPPGYHNFLVKMGLKERGLCCHWAEDLRSRFIQVNQETIKVDWLVARHGSSMREHNVIVLYGENMSWKQGMVYDPWRMAGRPYWTRVEQDKYPWKLHPLNGQWDLLRCK